MQEITTRRPTTPVHQSALRSEQHVRHVLTIESSFQDTLEDLQETGYLIEGLQLDREPATNGDHFQHQLREVLRSATASLGDRHARVTELINNCSGWSKSAFADAIATARNEHLEMKLALRRYYRQRGVLLCESDWQSPIYSSSYQSAPNRLAEGIQEHVWDYKRDGHLDALAYEKEFVAEYLSPKQPAPWTAYLTNSGMAAFTTVLHWLSHEQQMGAEALVLEPMYFENIHLLNAFFPNTRRLHKATREELLTHLQKHAPSVVVCDAVTNCGDIIVHDFQTILDWARHARHKLAIVIDSTCLPAPFLPPAMVENLSANVSVLIVESLAKHHQLGMDIVTGGVAICHMEESMQESFRKTRARLGTNIVDSAVGSLPPPRLARLTARMKRHCRNTKGLADLIEAEVSISGTQTALESAAWLSDSPAFCNWYHGTCITLRLRDEFRSIDFYKQFEAKVLELATQANHPIALSTSFGFDISRLYVTAPSTKFEAPFLRISVGTESRGQVTTLANLLIDAGRHLAKTSSVSRKTNSENLPTQAPLSFKPGLPTSPPLDQPQIVTGADLASSVFLGDNSLKNYLSPANFAATPMVELPSDLNPFKADGVRILAKLMPLVPLMNIKSIPAYSMLSAAADRGELESVRNIIESSSSNTVLSLSVLGKLFNINSTCAIVDHSIAPSLVRMLRLFGIEVLMHPGPGHKMYSVAEPRSERATKLGSQPGWINPGQYSNADNPEGFERWLSPQIWAQTDGRISVLSCGLGTCGTMVGVTRGLRKLNPGIEVVACNPKSGDAVPGPRERSQLADVAFDWHNVANANMELTAEESFCASIKLLRRGIMGGPSSGMNYAGALKYFASLKEEGSLSQKVAESNGDLWCVFLCCDSPLPHVDEYYDTLGDQHFPAVRPFEAPAN